MSSTYQSLLNLNSFDTDVINTNSIVANSIQPDPNVNSESNGSYG
jgi:hypothetical protein